MATQNNLAKRSVSVSALAKDPLAAVAQGEGFAVAVLNQNKRVFYCVPAKA
jgi:antitoxin StbD